MTDYTRLHKQLAGRVDGDPQVAHRTGTVDTVNPDGTLDVTVGGVVVPGVHQVQVGVSPGDPVQLVVWRGGLLALTADTSQIESDISGLQTGMAQLGKWSTWTPSLTNLPNTGAPVGQYMRIGDTVWWRFTVTLTGAAGAGPLGFTLPVTIQSVAEWQLFGSAILLEDGVSRRSAGVVWNADSSAVQFLISGYGAVLATAGQTTPFVWGNGDAISAQGWYRCQP